MKTIAEVKAAAARVDKSVSFSDDAAEFMTRAAPYQFNRMIEGLVREAKKAGVDHIDIAYLKEIDMYED